MVINMKKILSLIFACVICVIAIPVSAFADTQTTDDIPFGVITDSEGNIVEVLAMPKATYVNAIYTIPAGGHFISYQYEPSERFVFGFKTYNEDGDRIIDDFYNLSMYIEASNSIGGGGRKIVKHTIYYYGDKNNNPNECLLNVNLNQYDYRYYNGEIKNNSMYPTELRIMVVVDQPNIPYKTMT